MAKVEIYTKDYCPFCKRAKALLEGKNISFTEYDVTNDTSKFEEMLSRSSGSRTVPQIFIDDKHMGGCDDIYALDASGKLTPLLK